jgi:hypothetical protein
MQNNNSSNKSNRNSNNENNIDGSSFIELYEKAVVESLLMFGSHIPGIILLYLKEKHSITRLGYTAANPKLLMKALELVLNGGAKLAQRRILRLLYNNLGIEQTFDSTINFEEQILKSIKEFEKKIQDDSTSKSILKK